MTDKKTVLQKLEKLKIPALVFLLGMVLLLLPTGSGKTEARDPDTRLEEVLSRTQGVGRARVLISDKGVVVLCEGAEKPQVRLDIIRAVGSYTGFGSDKITVLKMAEVS